MREEQQETNRRLENLERRMESIEYRITIILLPICSKIHLIIKGDRTMQHKHFFAIGGFVAVALLTSCGAAKITDEQKAQISELRRQQASLGEKIKVRQSEIARLEAEIADRERAVTKCNEEKLALEQRLAKYPNAWPDYTEPAKDTVKTNTGKKK